MGKFIILGGSRLEGKVRISGSKNAVLPIMAASLLSGQASVLYQVPELADVLTMKKVLESLGAKANFAGNRAEIETKGVTRNGGAGAFDKANASFQPGRGTFVGTLWILQSELSGRM